MVTALSNTGLQDGYVAYPWERRMKECLPVPFSSCFLSVLLLPKASDQSASRYNDLEDTLARANAWLNASQASGVPVVFMNIQTESLLTKVNCLISKEKYDLRVLWWCSERYKHSALLSFLHLMIKWHVFSTMSLVIACFYVYQ